MEDDQQFCLRWNNHQSTLVAVFDTLLENGTLVDCTLAAEGKYLNAHKVVLSACSPYFESLLSQNYDKHPIFILKDVKFQELKAMMDYMYRGEVNISQDQLGALLKAAESLQIKGLSDNKKEDTKKAVPLPPAKTPPPTAPLPRVQGLTIEQRRTTRTVEESREGSQSPGPRKRKRMRRRSTDDIDNHHDASNSSESHHSGPAPVQNIPQVPPSSSKIADVPEPVETKAEVLRHKLPAAAESEVPQVPIIKEKIETHTELMLEPKSEYVEEMNEECIEDLTLDDDDEISNMDMNNDGAGPSHGNAGEGSSQGFGGWHMGNQSQDEVFLAAQEAVGAHRDSQDAKGQQHKGESSKPDFSAASPSSSPSYSHHQKGRRVRTSFQQHQLETLNEFFLKHRKNPDANDLENLKQKTGLSRRVLQVWFQNARAKWRKQLMREERKHTLGSLSRPIEPADCSDLPLDASVAALGGSNRTLEPLARSTEALPSSRSLEPLGGPGRPLDQLGGPSRPLEPLGGSSRPLEPSQAAESIFRHFNMGQSPFSSNSPLDFKYWR